MSSQSIHTNKHLRMVQLDMHIPYPDRSLRSPISKLVQDGTPSGLIWFQVNSVQAKDRLVQMKYINPLRPQEFIRALRKIKH